MIKLNENEKAMYRLIAVEELEADSMPDSVLISKDSKYAYFKCGSQKVKIER